MASSAKKALTALLIIGLLIGATAGYSILANLSIQGGLLPPLSSLLFPSYLHHIPYTLSTPITLSLNMDWWKQIFRNPPPFRIPDELRNIPINYIPPIHAFYSGLIDPSIIIMVVEPQDPSYPHQYWKVSTFDYYGEGDWFKTQLITYPTNLTSPSSLPPGSQFFSVRMNLSHKALSSTTLPTLYPDPYFINITSSQGDLKIELERDEYNNSRVTLFFTSNGISEIVYSIAGIPPNITWIASNALPASYTPPAISNIYTQLPQQLRENPTFTSFAQGFQGVGRNAYELALAVQAELLSGKYTNNIMLLLDGRPLPDKDPVVAFLENEVGTCIDFASTFATTLRYLGVSARLVIGYYDGYAETDYSGGRLKYIIKAYNLHAWVEVWVPTSGSGVWVPFDPTPPPTIPPPSGMGWWFEQQFNIPLNLVGSLGPIGLFSYGLKDDRPVFNATPEHPSSPVRYWRLKAFDYYDGDWGCSNQTTYELQTWTKTELENFYGTVWYYTALINLEHQVNLTTLLPFPFPGPYVLGGTEYAISSLQGDLVSATLLSDNLNNLYLNAVFTGHGTSTIRYTVATYNLDLASIRNNAKQPQGNIPPGMEQYLQIPNSLQSNETFISFVNSITNGSNAYETALNALNRLTSGEYVYDVSLLLNGVQASGDPIVWFLTSKSGTPIHFASTFTMAMRSKGIPARLVVGYLTRPINNGGVHEARSSLVHAWAEVWIPTGNGEGYWVSFDPIPDPLPLPITFQDDGLLSWGKLPRSDPNVQRTNFNVSISSPYIVNRGGQFSVAVTVTKDGALQSNLLVDIYVYDSWMKQEYYKGSGTTTSGSVSVLITVGSEVKIGNITIVAKVHSSNEPGSPLIACNYTAGTILNGTTAMNTTITSTAPYGSTTLIRSDGTVKVNGTLYDPVYSGSMKGIPNATIQIMRNGSEVGSVTTYPNGYFEYYYPDSMSLDLVDYTFQAVYSGRFGGSHSSNVTISIYARSHITLALEPSQAVKNGTTLTFTAQLSLDNSTPIINAEVYVSWYGSNYTLSNAGDGKYTYNITVSVNSLGYYTANATFGGSGRVLGSTSENRRILVYSGGLILIEGYTAEVYKGEVALFSGHVWDENDAPVAGVMLRFKFSNASGVVYTYDASERTNASGFFSCSVPVPSLSPGTYTVEVESRNETLAAMSNSVNVQVKVKPSIILSGFSSSSLLGIGVKQLAPLVGSFMPSERAFITARVVDGASQTPLGGLNFTVYYNGVPLSNGITDADGLLNITLSDLSLFPVNSVSTLTVSYPGNETIGAAQFSVKIHVFNDAEVMLSVPGKVVIGKPLTISVSVLDPNGNPVVGRTFTVYWNMTFNIGSSTTNESGNGAITYNVPSDAAEGDLTIYVVVDSGDSAMVRTLLVKENLMEGYMVALIYALQVGGSSPVLPLLIVGVLAALSLLIIYVYMSRMRTVSAKKPKPAWDFEALDELAKAGRYKEAVIQIYRMYIELINAYLKVERAPHETTRDVARKAVKSGLPPKLVNTITQLFEKARFSKHEITSSDYKEAAKTFNEIYNEVTGGTVSIG
ncbi:MAG: DUF4129 domain-containing protein [Candidatus Freyarchaeota archaeon]|nr:DUF4129 domain-containing protein [Candidatus Jordarchaeia archaeon]